MVVRKPRSTGRSQICERSGCAQSAAPANPDPGRVWLRSMKIFFDTSVLVASAVRSHEHHSRALHAVERVANKMDLGVISVHTLGELYAVLTRLPISPAIQPGEAVKIVRENVVQYFRVQVLNARDYTSVVLRAAENGIVGGAIYDLLLLAAAQKAKAARIYTFNVVEFRRLAPELHGLISAP